MSVSFSCPECQKVLRTAVAPPAGKKIKCPSCAYVFSPEVDSTGRSESPSAGSRSSFRSPDAAREGVQAGKPRSRARLDDDDDLDNTPRKRGSAASRSSWDDDDLEDERPRRKKKRQEQGSPILLFALLGGGIFLLAVLAITAFVWPGFLKSMDQAPPIAKGPGPGPMPGGPVPGAIPGPMPGPMPGPGPGPVPIGGGAGWQDLNMNDMGFRVQMPGTPKRQEQNIAGLKQTIFAVEQGPGAYMVFHQRNPPGIGNDRIVLQKAVDGIAATGARVTNTKFITFQGANAVEVQLALNNPPGMQATDLIILSADQMYQVMVVGTADFVRSGDAQKFKSSFQLLR